MWRRIPWYGRLAIVVFGTVYGAMTIDLLFRLPVLGIVMIGALVWVGWSVFGLLGLLGTMKSGKFR